MRAKLILIIASLLASAILAMGSETVAAALVLEAASEGQIGMQAVANVIGNRAARAGVTFDEIVLEPHQFSSFLIGRSAAIKKASTDPRFRSAWPTAMKIANSLDAGTLQDITGGSVYFENIKAFGAPSHYNGGGITIKHQVFWNGKYHFHRKTL